MSDTTNHVTGVGRCTRREFLACECQFLLPECAPAVVCVNGAELFGHAQPPLGNRDGSEPLQSRLYGGLTIATLRERF